MVVVESKPHMFRAGINVVITAFMEDVFKHPHEKVQMAIVVIYPLLVVHLIPFVYSLFDSWDVLKVGYLMFVMYFRFKHYEKDQIVKKLFVVNSICSTIFMVRVVSIFISIARWLICIYVSTKMVQDLALLAEIVVSNVVGVKDLNSYLYDCSARAILLLMIINDLVKKTRMILVKRRNYLMKGVGLIK